jgi:hypothetical protein
LRKKQESSAGNHKSKFYETFDSPFPLFVNFYRNNIAASKLDFDTDPYNLFIFLHQRDEKRFQNLFLFYSNFIKEMQSTFAELKNDSNGALKGKFLQTKRDLSFNFSLEMKL